MKLTKKDFIEKAREIHKDKYDYSKIPENIPSGRTKVLIICPKHGEFYQKAYDHLHRHGCPICANNKPLTTEEFVKRAREVHRDKYDYSKTVYIKNNKKVIIICPEHGEFEVTPISHLNVNGFGGCHECANELKRKRFSDTTESFIEKAKKIHGDKYDYSKVKYINSETPVTIICPEHGEFSQRPVDHLRSKGCPKCAIEQTRLTLQEFIERSKKIHGDRYDYSRTSYVNIRTKVIIGCSVHGFFEQTPASHLSGNGCPKCSSSMLQNNIRMYLNQNNIQYIEEYTWDWLIYSGNQRVDFYLPEYNVVIEAQGAQHFTTIEFFDNFESFEVRLDKDSNKQKLCLEHGIRVYYFSNIIKDNILKDFKYPYQVFEDTDELFKYIKYDFDFYNNLSD